MIIFKAKFNLIVCLSGREVVRGGALFYTSFIKGGLPVKAVGSLDSIANSRFTIELEHLHQAVHMVLNHPL